MTTASRPPTAALRQEGTMLIDCDGCGIRGAGCADCLVTALFEGDPSAVGPGSAEHRAIEVFARAGFEVEVLAHEPGPAIRRRPPRRHQAAWPAPRVTGAA